MTLMVIKRDGRQAEFDDQKIKAAIEKAAHSCETLTDFDIIGVHTQVLDAVAKLSHHQDAINIEDIQDAVEKALIHCGYDDVARCYIRYRDERARIRDSKSRVNQQIKELITIDACESDTKRENANIDGDTMCGSMLKIGGTVTKEYFYNNVLGLKYRALHDEGKLHIHDADLALLSINCLYIPLAKVLKHGFSTGHGYIRPPKSINTAANLACIVLQSNQNDQFGGQSFPTLDYDLAPYVAKSFVKNIALIVSIRYHIEMERLKVTLIEPLHNYIDKHDRILTDDGKAEVKAFLKANYVGRTEFDGIITDAIHMTDKDTFQAMEAMVFNLNTMQSRSGGQTPFSSVNFGTDTSEEGRMVTRNLLLNVKKGLGYGETAIFPITVFKILKGVTDKGSPNYDLYRLACEVSALRLYPNFVNVSAPMNFQYYRPGKPETEIAAMGCRTRVLGNSVDPEHEQTTGRGNLFFTTMNLPFFALEVINNPNIENKIDGFFKLLAERMNDVLKISRLRFEYIASRKAKNFPFLMGQHLYLSSEQLHPEDEIREVIKQGSISIGFIGIAETLVALMGKHHGESKEANELGMKIVKFMHDMCDKYSEQEGLNYSLFATPAEGCSGRLMRAIKRKFGTIPGISDKEYLTNSFHVPVYYQCTAEQKINIEAPYHPLCTAGCIGYVELSYEATKNIDAFETLVNAMADSGMTYFSINHPVDYDPVCGYVGYIPGDTCPRCGRKEGEGISIEKLRELKIYRPSPEFIVE